MGGFNPVSTVLNTVGSAVGLARDVQKTYGDVSGLKNAYRQAEKEYEDNERSIAEESALEQKRLQTEEQQETMKRRSALRRAVAQQQADFGARGIDTADGSGEAVMLGLLQESSDEKAYRDRLNNLKRESLAQQTDARRRRNLLSLQSTTNNARDRFISNF